jgi:hypothetical protein
MIKYEWTNKVKHDSEILKCQHKNQEREKKNHRY